MGQLFARSLPALWRWQRRWPTTVKVKSIYMRACYVCVCTAAFKSSHQLICSATCCLSTFSYCRSTWSSAAAAFIVLNVVSYVFIALKLNLIPLLTKRTKKKVKIKINIKKCGKNESLKINDRIQMNRIDCVSAVFQLGFLVNSFLFLLYLFR